MKAISLWQPWASLVASGAKRIETRSWATLYRGELLIHASQRFDRGQRRIAYHREPFRSVLIAAHLIPDYSMPDLIDGEVEERLPRGCFVARATLARIVPTDFIMKCGGTVHFVHGDRECHINITDQELAFGDYTPGRFAWLLADVQALPQPFPARGMLGLWEWDGTL